MNRLYPVFLNLEGAPCVVVGGGRVAARKIAALLECGATITVVAPEPDAEIRALARGGRLRLIERPFQEGDLKGARLVISAAADRAVNEKVFHEAARDGVWCNVADQPELCDFHVPSTLTRGDLKIAISTNAKAPAFAARLRRMLEEEIGEDYGRAIRRLGDLRERLRRRLADDANERMAALRDRLNWDDLFDALRRRDTKRVDAILSSWISPLSD